MLGCTYRRYESRQVAENCSRMASPWANPKARPTSSEMERRPGEGSRTGILEEGVKPRRVESIHGASHSVIELTTSMLLANVDKSVGTVIVTVTVAKLLHAIKSSLENIIQKNAEGG